MHFSLGDKNLIQLRCLLEDIKKAIDLIERQKLEREKQRALEARKPSQLKRKAPPKVPARRVLQAPTVQTSEATPALPESVQARVTPAFQPQTPISPPPAPPVPQIKYMHPVNRNLTWDGAGQKPGWILIYLDRGGSWSALENAAQLFSRRRRPS